jgi:nucleotide-binding universal stress UspA family protein
MKNVLVLLHDDPGQEARLQVAVDLTRALSGHLTCLDVVVPPAAVSDYFEVSGGAMTMEYVRERESENRSVVEARLQREDVSWSMTETIGAPGRALRNASDLADIIVVSGPGDESEGAFRRIVGEVAVKSGRPVMAVPLACRGLNVAGSALVGWNGSHEASEALRQAVPLLQRAASVTVLDVNPSTEDLPVGEAAGYLSRHGIHAEVVTRDSQGTPISDIILDEAHARGAAYVVIGAYGLPRSIEAVFGGVTAGMLQKSDLPILLAR